MNSPSCFVRNAILCFALVLAQGPDANGQNVVPPPGFVPGQGDDFAPSPPPQEPRIFTGSGEDADPYRYSSSGRQYDQVRSTPRGIRTFRQPTIPEVVLDDGPPLPKVWFRAEALYWWTKASPLPVPIVTQGSPADPIPGALGQPGTSILIGDQNLRLPGRGGGRFTFGFSFDPAQTWGFEVSYFSLANSALSQSVSSSGAIGSPLLAFPFFNPNIPGEAASPISLPGAFAGTAVLTMQSFLQGDDLNFLHNVMTSNGVRIDLLGGFRNVNLQEGLNFSTDSPNVPPNAPAFFHTFDSFTTNNNFYGGQFGVRASYDSARVFINGTSKLAIGDSVEMLSVNGGTFTNIGGGFSSANGSYLSQPTNIGSQRRDQFAVVPELNLNVGLRLRPWASIIVGYSFLYISSVARPGNQIDRVINPTQSSAISNNYPANLVGAARPDLSIHNADFWAQGLNFALEFRF